MREHDEAMRNKAWSAGRPGEHSERLERLVSRVVTIILDNATKLRTIFLQLIFQNRLR